METVFKMKRLLGKETGIESNQKLSIKGPYKWPEVYDAPESTEAGIYIWTIPWGKFFLTHYVGMTIKTLEKRNKERVFDTCFSKSMYFTIVIFRNQRFTRHFLKFYVHLRRRTRGVAPEPLGTLEAVLERSCRG